MVSVQRASALASSSAALLGLTGTVLSRYTPRISSSVIRGLTHASSSSDDDDDDDGVGVGDDDDDTKDLSSSTLRDGLVCYDRSYYVKDDA